MLCYYQDSLGTAAWLCFGLLCNLEMATKIGRKLSFFECFENTNTSGGREAWAAAAAATTTKTKLPELFNQPRGWHLWEQISKTWEAVPAQWMSADSRASQADTLQPICKTPLRLKKSSNPEEEAGFEWWLWSLMAWSWHRKASPKGSWWHPCPPRCLWPCCCPRDGNCLYCPWMKSTACFSVSQPFRLPNLCKMRQ